MKRRSSWGLILFVVAVVAWFVAVRGQLNAFAQNSLTAEVKSSEVQSYRDRLSQVETIRTKGGADAQARLDAYFLALPKLPQIPEVLVMIEQMANSAGVSFNSVGVGAASAGEVPVAVTFGGSLPSITSFLDTLNENVRTVHISSQTLTADKGGNLTVTMSMGLVYQGGAQ